MEDAVDYNSPYESEAPYVLDVVETPSLVLGRPVEGRERRGLVAVGDIVASAEPGTGNGKLTIGNLIMVPV